MSATKVVKPWGFELRFVRTDRYAGKALFIKVETGITGITDIEVTGGELKEGDEIVTGSYRALRTLKPGAPVKVDNKAPQREETERN